MSVEARPWCASVEKRKLYRLTGWLVIRKKVYSRQFHKPAEKMDVCTALRLKKKKIKKKKKIRKKGKKKGKNKDERKR